MSGFVASNSRIVITDTVGSVEEPVFDTDHDMPHIVGTADQDVTVTFGDFPQEIVYWFTNYCAGYQPVTTCGYQYVCTTEYVWVAGYSECGFDCFYSYPEGFTCSYTCNWVNGYGYTEYVCTNEYVCTETWECYSENYDQIKYKSSNTENIQDICNLPTDEDGNAINIDFVVIKAKGSRTLAGTDKRVSTSFLTTVPADTFSFQGSMMLESSLQDNGDSWMKRIMSVVIDNASGKLKLKSKQTSAPRETSVLGSTNKATASTFSFNFKIFFGRFKS